MKIHDKVIKEIDNIEIPQIANTYKFEYADGRFVIFFGYWNASHEVEVLSKIVLTDEIIIPFIDAMIEFSGNYEKEFNRDIYPEDLRKRLREIEGGE